MTTPLEAALRRALHDPTRDLATADDLIGSVTRRAERRRRRRAAALASVALLLPGTAGLLWLTYDMSGQDSTGNALTSSPPPPQPTVQPPSSATPDPAHLYPYGFVAGAKNAYVDVTTIQPTHTLSEALAYFAAHDSQARAIGARRPDATHYWLLTQPRANVSRRPVWVLQWFSQPDGAATSVAANDCVTTYIYDDQSGTGLTSTLACPGRLFTDDPVQPSAVAQ